MRLNGSILLVALALLAPVGLWAQQTEMFVATHMVDLRGYHEPDPVTDSARGFMFLRVNPDTRMVRYRMSVTGLANITAAHFHRGARGISGPVVQSISGLSDASLTVTGTWTPSQGVFDSMMAGLVYVNVHTAANPPGHIRGVVMPIPNLFVPVINSAQEAGHTVLDTAGEGEGFIYLNEATKTLRYFFRWRGLGSPVSMAHFHIGQVFTSGPVVHAIPVTPDAQEAVGEWVLPDTMIAKLKSGLIYVNVHTQANPQGEIRGQVLPGYAFAAAIDPVNEVPSRADNSDGAGSGFAVIAITPLGAILGGEAIVGNLTTPITMAHIHIGAKGENGPPFQALQPDSTGLVLTVPAGVNRRVTADTLALFLNTGAYMNVHTEMFDAGEARGQLVPTANNLVFGTTSVSLATPPASTTQLSVSFSPTAIRFSTEAALRNATVELYDATGSLVGRADIEGGAATIDASGLASGYYTGCLIESGTVRASKGVLVTR